ncbi:MAG TPA: hypothetical protein ENJ28_05010 [Gammaproteobacteria bacterium]|nr:hypothetical protein [Gammaproteobacteria bacterium]
METKEELEYLFHEAKEDASRYIRYAREAEQVAKDLEVKLKKLEEKPWSPEGKGGYCILSNGEVGNHPHANRYKEFGTQGTKEQMENLRNPMMHLASQHAWARERSGIAPFVAGEKNWYVAYDYNIQEFTPIYESYWESKTEIYMTKRDAKAYANMMKKGLIAFPCEEN